MTPILSLQDALAEEDGEDVEYDRLQDSLLQDFNFGGGLLQRKEPGQEAEEPGQEAEGGAPGDPSADGSDQRRTKKEVGHLGCLHCNPP